VVEHLSCKCEALSSNLSIPKNIKNKLRIKDKTVTQFKNEEISFPNKERDKQWPHHKSECSSLKVMKEGQCGWAV
jgi:hypothetical protein